jgi:acyl-CoA dehydrogenase
MYNLHLTPEQLEIRDTLRDFVTQRVKPVTLKPERLEALDRRLPQNLLDQASRLGLRTLALSEDSGGSGADALTACIVAEELAAGDPDLASVLGETSRLTHLLFDRAMTEQQRETFLTAFLADEAAQLALADREPDQEHGLGINYHRPAAIEPIVQTKAVRRQGEIVINGRKTYVANAPLAKLFAVTVTMTPGADHDGVRIVLVPHDAPGVTVKAHDDGERWFHGGAGDVTFSDCRVPADNLLAVDAALLRSGGATLAAATALGIGRAAHEAALDYAGLRVQGGRRILEHQAIAAKLADNAIRLQVARAAVWQAAWAADHPEAQHDRSLSDLPLDTIAAVFTAEAVHRVAKDAAECFGAMGVMRDMPLHKYVRDALISLHAGDGPSEAKLAIAEALAGYRRLPAAAIRAAE